MEHVILVTKKKTALRNLINYVIIIIFILILIFLFLFFIGKFKKYFHRSELMNTKHGKIDLNILRLYYMIIQIDIGISYMEN